MTKVTGHGSIRKFKNGAAGVLALSTLFLGVSQVSANETQVDAKTAKTEVSKSTEATTPSEEKNLSEADNAPATDKAEVLKKTDVEKKENFIAPKDAKEDVVKLKNNQNKNNH